MVYGGKVLDNFDRRILFAYLDEYLGDFLFDSFQRFHFYKGDAHANYAIPHAAKSKIDFLGKFFAYILSSIFRIFVRAAFPLNGKNALKSHCSRTNWNHHSSMDMFCVMSLLFKVHVKLFELVNGLHVNPLLWRLHCLSELSSENFVSALDFGTI